MALTTPSARRAAWRSVAVPAAAEISLVPGAAVIAAAAAVALGPKVLAVPAAIAGAVVLLRYPAVLLGVFVFIPSFKSLPAIAALPVDPTMALGALLAGVCAYRLRVGRVQTPPAFTFVLPLLFLIAMLALGTLWTLEPSYGHQKLFKFATVTALAALAPFFIIENRRDLLMLCLSLAIGAVGIAILAPLVHPTVASGITTELDTQGRYSFGGQIFPARFLCNGAVILLLAANYGAGRWRVLAPLIGAGVVVIAVGFGSRGPMLAFALTVVAIAMLGAIQSRRLLAAWITVVVLFGAVAAVVQVPGVASQRLTAVFTNPVQALEQDPRYPLYREAVIQIGRHPLLGLGTGGYEQYAGALSPHNQILQYPHNLFLELGSELGVIPPLVLLGMVIVVLSQLVARLRRSPRRREAQLFTLAFALLLYNLLASQTSGDINDNRAFWLFLGVAVLVARRPTIVRLTER